MIKFFIAFIVCGMLFTGLRAQDPYFEYLTKDKGLAHNRVLALIQDHTGFLWLGTQNGLNRFDGYQFNTYRYSPGDSLGISGSAVRTLFEDRFHTLWIGTDGSGLNEYNPGTGTFRHYFADPADPESLSHNDVYFVTEDRAGNIWVGTWGGGLNKLDRRSGKFTRYQHSKADPRSLSDNYVRTMIQDRKGHLWIGTSYGGLNKFDPISGTFTHYRPDPKNPHSLPENPIIALAEDEEGFFWVGTDGGGLSRFDPASGKCQVHLRHNPSDPGSLSHDNVSAIYRDRSGRWWVGTWGGGLNRFDPATGRFQRHLSRKDDAPGISHNEIFSISEDRSGLLLIATNGGGVTVMDVDRNDFGRYSFNRLLPDRPVNASVRAILEDRQGRVWLGTNGEALFRFDPAGGKLTHFPHKPGNAQSVPNQVVTSLHEDQSGAIWLGTHEGGLSRLDPANNQFLHYRHDPKNPESLSDNRVMTVYEDREGDLWVGTYDQGLNRLNRSANTFERYVHQPDKPASISHNAIRAVFQDRAGNLWIGTMGGGLNKFDKQRGEFTHYLHLPADTTSISNDYVRTIFEDTDGYLWIGTEEAGLNKFDPRKGTFTRFTDKDGLPDNVILGILGDGNGNIWLTTNNGLCRFNLRTYATQNYYAMDGLQSDGFCIGAYHRGRSGKLYVGGYGGFNAFYPSEIKDTTYLPPVVITDFKIFNNSRPLLLQEPVIELSRDDKFFSFDFAALNYTNADKNMYAYQLKGFDKNWVYSGTRRYASYTNLPPGEYTFRVKVANSEGIWSPVVARVNLRINPPFWHTWAFRIIAGIGLLGLVYIGYYWRVYTIRQQNILLEQLVQQRTQELKKMSVRLVKSLDEAEKQKQEADFQRRKAEEANQFKTRLLGIAAHDLQNPLCSIKLYADLIRQTPNLPEDAISMTSAVENASQNMIELISKLLRSVRSESMHIRLTPQLIDLSELAQQAVERNQLLARQKQQIITFSGDAHCRAEVDREIMGEVLDNLISNAIKYSFPKQQIRVSVQERGDTVELRVADEGIGIGRADIPRLFEKFSRIAPTTGGESSVGLGLSIVKQFVSLFQGTVRAESAGENRGSVFIVNIPRAGTEAPHRLTSETDPA